MSYQTPRNTRRESRTIVGRFRGGKLNPVMAVPVRGNEGGMLSQNIALELDPIAGRMITPISAEYVSVFVPVQAMDQLSAPGDAYAGVTDVVREKLLSGNPLFGLSDEHEISRRCGVIPRSINGEKKVSHAIHLAHNCAVNFLRRRKYDKAAQLIGPSKVVTPALIGQTVLDRLNGVLDPDDRINGAVQLEIPHLRLPVQGLFAKSGDHENGTFTNKINTTSDGKSRDGTHVTDAGQPLYIGSDGIANNAHIGVFADLNGVAAGAVSLTDFYNSEKMDNLTRTMRTIVDENPEYGEEMVLRWAHGLSVDVGRTPFVIHEQSRMFARNIVGAMDTGGVEQEIMRSDMMLEMSFTVPVPRTELGGIVITFAVLKPDETLARQPHPFLSDVWGVDNFVADELAMDPVPVTVRDLDSDATAGQENNVVFYTGHNALKRTYVNYGLCAQLDPNTIENKTALWQLEIPLSVTPQNILYPSNLPHTPFADTQAEVCTYSITSNCVLQTPLIFGPTPVEQLAVIGDENLFEGE